MKKDTKRLLSYFIEWFYIAILLFSIDSLVIKDYNKLFNVLLCLAVAGLITNVKVFMYER